MSESTRPLALQLRNRLARGLATALALTASSDALAAATSWLVDNCADTNTSGTLRYAVNNAASGDSIDMTALACSPISLATGALVVTQDILTIHGPTATALRIDGSLSASRIVDDEVVGGKLYMDHVTLSNGTFAPPSGVAYGGCLYAKGSVYLDHVTVYGCTATSGSASAAGGGLFVHDTASIVFGSIHDNTVADGTGAATGGGFANAISATGSFTMQYSTVAGNQVSGAIPTLVNGGGLRLREGGTITSSTISGNTSNGNAGGLIVSTGSPQFLEFKLINSTVSGNTVFHQGSGVIAAGVTTTVSNSTIAFNYSNDLSTTNSYPLAGLVVNGAAVTLTLNSSIVANNLDLNATPPENDIGFLDHAPGTVTGANNLIGAGYNGLMWGTATISATCPQLGPLRDNGGPTWTHALLSGSPALDVGSNALHLSTDQRGTGYLRPSGAGTDIGSYEVQPDIVFDAAFDGCPAL